MQSSDLVIYLASILLQMSQELRGERPEFSNLYVLRL